MTIALVSAVPASKNPGPPKLRKISPIAYFFLWVVGCATSLVVVQGALKSAGDPQLNFLARTGVWLFLAGNIVHLGYLYSSLHRMEEDPREAQRFSGWLNTPTEFRLRVAIFFLMLMAAGKFKPVADVCKKFVLSESDSGALAGITGARVAVVSGALLFMLNIIWDWKAKNAGGHQWFTQSDGLQIPTKLGFYFLCDGIAFVSWFVLAFALWADASLWMWLPFFSFAYFAIMIFRLSMSIKERRDQVGEVAKSAQPTGGVMRNRVLVVCALVLSLLLGLYSLVQVREMRTRLGADSKVSAMDRVVESGTLRVGYLILPPYLTKRAENGELSGIFYDVTQELGKRLGLKIEWVEEVTLATLGTGFETNRYDMIAFPLWRNAGRSKVVAFSVPLFYSTVGAYVRDGDKRFDAGLRAIDDPSIRIAAMDGELAEEIGRSDFPNAQIVSLPQFSDYSQLLLEVASGKSDVTFFNRVLGNRFIRRNPGRVRDVTGDKPVRVFAECFILPADDYRFNAMINASVLELVENGVVDRAFEAHGEDPREYYRIALPYREPAL